MSELLTSLIKKVDEGEELSREEYTKVLTYIELEMKKAAAIVEKPADSLDKIFYSTTIDILSDVRQMLYMKYGDIFTNTNENNFAV